MKVYLPCTLVEDPQKGEKLGMTKLKLMSIQFIMQIRTHLRVKEFAINDYAAIMEINCSGCKLEHVVHISVHLELF